MREFINVEFGCLGEVTRSLQLKALTQDLRRDSTYRKGARRCAPTHGGSKGNLRKSYNFQKSDRVLGFRLKTF
ncbi:MAG TPA: hypothetical protein V6C85_08545 [Allocoleopsis sp.]